MGTKPNSYRIRRPARLHFTDSDYGFDVAVPMMLDDEKELKYFKHKFNSIPLYLLLVTTVHYIPHQGWFLE